MWNKLVRFFQGLFGQDESAKSVAMPQSELVGSTKLAANHCRSASPIVRDGRRHPNKVQVHTRAGAQRVAKVVSRDGATVTCRRLHQRRLFRATLLTD